MYDSQSWKRGGGDGRRSRGVLLSVAASGPDSGVRLGDVAGPSRSTRSRFPENAFDGHEIALYRVGIFEHRVQLCTWNLRPLSLIHRRDLDVYGIERSGWR